MVLSSILQQTCTSPTQEDLTRALHDHGDFTFGGNQPLSMLRRKKLSNIFFWLTLVFTSVPLHLLLNAMLGESYGFDSLDDLSDQLSNGTCQIVLRTWIAFIVGVMVFIKAFTILGFVISSRYWKQERCNTLGDLIATSVGHCELRVHSGTRLDKVMHKTAFLSRMSLFEHMTIMDFGPILLATLALAGIATDVAAQYNSPEGQTLNSIIVVILAANVCPTLLYCSFV